MASAKGRDHQYARESAEHCTPRRRRAERRRRGGSCARRGRRKRSLPCREGAQSADPNHLGSAFRRPTCEGSDDWRIVPELAPDDADALVEKSYATRLRTPSSRRCSRVSESGGSSSSAQRPMPASVRRSTGRSCEATMRRSSEDAHTTGDRTAEERRLRNKSSRTRTCIGITRRSGAHGRNGGHRGGQLPRDVLKPKWSHLTSLAFRRSAACKR